MDLKSVELTLGDDNNFTISVPFTKVDRKNRTVQGFATLDNVDHSKDILDNDASLEAFAEWPGNVREMHQKIAVGKAVTATPMQYFDTKTQKTYDGIFVKARVSEGAEDTWKKVLDETLTGFSVGGAILKTRNEVADDGTPVRRVTKYRLNELSLVDAPCNGLATFSLIKDREGTPILDDGELEKVNYKADTPIGKFLPRKIRERETKAGNGLGPIQTQAHMDYASHLVNDAKDPYAMRAHIINSSNSLGLRLPAGWDNSKGITDMKKDADGDNDNDADAMDECKGCDTEAGHLTAAQAHLREAAGKAAARDDHNAAANLHNHAADLDYMKQKAALADLKKSLEEDQDLIKVHKDFRLEKAVLTSKARNKLPKSAFAYVDEKGVGHFPVHDANHTRNALARLDQSPYGPQARPKVLAAAKKFGIDVAEGTEKSLDLSDNKNNDKNEDEQQTMLLRKFLDIVEGLKGEKPSLDNKESKEDNKSKMEKEELAKALEGFGEDLNKTLKKKLSVVMEQMEKSAAESGKLSTEIKDELTAKLDALSARMDALEASGALKKSTEGDGTEKLEKDVTGGKNDDLWSDSIVPSLLKERFSSR